MKVLVTGADGFVGRNLRVRLRELGHEPVPFTRASGLETLPALVAESDAIIHLAGANRPPAPDHFAADNLGLTATLAKAVQQAGGRPLAFASSIQASLDNSYGASKRAAEDALVPLGQLAPVALYRFPNIFGKWARPFYNSAVATFCHQAANGIPLSINDPAAPLTLVFVDDVISAFLSFIEGPHPHGVSRPEVQPQFRTTVGEVASLIVEMAAQRESLGVARTGSGLARAIYATFLTHLPKDRFSYPLPAYGDQRGRFVEAVKTADSGQISYFTQVPGVERGGHYHHAKSEKFLVVRGAARFRFRNLLSGEHVEVDCRAEEPRIVDTIPGWAHDVVNLGNEEMVVLVWANEVFDRENPDTIVAKVIE